MEENLIGIVGVLGFGVGAQWLAWHFKSPSILFLLIFGFIAGPITGIVNPEHLFGDSFYPFVSIAVAIILFEGGMTLKFSELKRVGSAVRNLVTIGALITWCLATWGAWKLLGLSLSLASVLGAIFVVTGPTVIMPMLRHLRLSGKIGPVLKWEAMLNDPIGVILAVLVFEAVLAGNFQDGTHVVLWGVARTLFFGISFGLASGWLMTFLLSRYWVPDYLQSAVTLAMVTLTAVLSNLFQHESGLFAATIMGIVLANQKKVSIHHIMEFKENLRVLLISTLFIVLAARLRPESFLPFDYSFMYFFAFLIFVVRPASVFISTMKTGLDFKEKLFLSWMAPRGIVAAATASVFALSLEAAGHAEAEKLLNYTFLVIVGTVLVYGLSAPMLAYGLKVAKSNPQGVLFFSARPWAQDLALMLKDNGVKPLLVDANDMNIRHSRKKGLLAVSGNVLSSEFIDRMDLSQIGYFLALSANNEANTLACSFFGKIFGKKNIYQLPSIVDESDNDPFLHKPEGRILFGSQITCDLIEAAYQKGGWLNSVHITTDYSFEAFREQYGNRAIILFVIQTKEKLAVNVSEAEIEAKEGETIIFLEQEAPKVKGNS